MVLEKSHGKFMESLDLPFLEGDERNKQDLSAEKIIEE